MFLLVVLVEVLGLAEPLEVLVAMLVALLLVAVLAELLVVLVAVVVEILEVFFACRHKVQLEVVVDSVA